MPTSRTSDEHAVERPAKVGEHYEVIRKIGEGSFGVIYLGKTDMCKDLVAIKFESKKSKAPQLRDEYRAYRHINQNLKERSKTEPDPEMLKGIPTVFYYGQETLFNFLILDYLGPSLEDLFDRCGRKFSLKTTAFLAVQMISRVQMIHRAELIYRDIKPDNFLLGRAERHDDRTVYVVDFGMAKHYINPRTREHIPFCEKKSLSGTARYMSINTHLGREQSRRDDMESLGNVFLYFLRGSLPWQGLKARDNREKYEKIGHRKQNIPVLELCAGLPPEVANYVAYTRRLAFEEEPDYKRCKDWFAAIYDKQDPQEPFDWDKPANMRACKSGSSKYESPASTPNHIPLNAGTRTDRTTGMAPLGPADSPARFVSPIASRAGPDSLPRKSLLRRLFCLCTVD